MTTTYGIVGTGTASTRAITAALGDLPSDAQFAVTWTGKPTDGQAAVYDWLIDNERKFVVVGKPSKTLREYASDIIEVDTGIDQALLSFLHPKTDTLLVLWDDNLEDTILKAYGAGLKILELTNGLVPIEVADDDEEEIAAPVEEVEEAPAPNDLDPIEDGVREDMGIGFSREEMGIMPAAAVKRHATNKGIDIKGLTKDEIIDLLYPTDDAPKASHVEPIVIAPEPKTDDTPVSILVCFKSGAVMSINASSDTLQRMLLQLS